MSAELGYLPIDTHRFRTTTPFPISTPQLWLVASFLRAVGLGIHPQSLWRGYSRGIQGRCLSLYLGTLPNEAKGNTSLIPSRALPLKTGNSADYGNEDSPYELQRNLYLSRKHTIAILPQTLLPLSLHFTIRDSFLCADHTQY